LEAGRRRGRPPRSFWFPLIVLAVRLTMSKTAITRVRITRALVPEMIRVARLAHGRPAERIAAVLGAWTNLAGVSHWTPSMVNYIERRMSGGRN